MSEIEEIDPCPRCGAKGWMVVGDNYYVVTCRQIHGVGCGLTSHGRPSEKEAISQWNRLKDRAFAIPQMPGKFVHWPWFTAAEFSRFKELTAEGDDVLSNWHQYWSNGPGYPIPRNRTDAAALARLILAYLEGIDAHIGQAVARMETDTWGVQP